MRRAHRRPRRRRASHYSFAAVFSTPRRVDAEKNERRARVAIAFFMSFVARASRDSSRVHRECDCSFRTFGA